MAKVFISHRLTGENLTELAQFLRPIADVLEKQGHKVFCSALYQQEMDSKNLEGYDPRLQYCLQKQDDADLVLSVIRSELPSNGMREELRKAKELRQRYLLCIKDGLEYKEFREYAEKIVVFSDLVDLLQKLAGSVIHYEIQAVT